MLAEFYEPPSLIRSDEANLINALLVSLNVVDCNLCVKEEDLDSQQGVIDFSLYLRTKREMVEDSNSLRSDPETETETNMSTVLDQKNYIEELNRHLNATVTNLQAKVEGLTTTNALMKEDLSISRNSVEKIQLENRRLKGELDKFRKIEKKSESSPDIHKQGQEEKKTSVVQTSYESGIKELSQEFRVRLQEELTQREEVEKQLDKQNSLKNQMELSIQNLEEDVTEKQATIGSLKSQLEDIKCINLEMYTKLADIQEHCPHCSRPLCQAIKQTENHVEDKNGENKNIGQLTEKQNEAANEDSSGSKKKDNMDKKLERFMFSFYVKIEREKSEDENAIEIKNQLQNLEEIENINLLYFKRYFNRLQFNEVVIDFVTYDSVLWKREPKKILRKLCGYNDAYKFSQLKIENPYIS